jgi:hypothetical protein
MIDQTPQRLHALAIHSSVPATNCLIFLLTLLLKLQQHAQMLGQRNLLILGRSLVTNTLLLSPSNSILVRLAQLSSNFSHAKAFLQSASKHANDHARKVGLLC